MQITRIALVLFTAGLVACGSSDKQKIDPLPSSASLVPSAARPRLHGGARSRETLVRTVLKGFADRDTAALAGVLIDRDEFIGTLYPELAVHYPVAKDTRPETKAFLWENQSLNSAKGLGDALRELGGRRMDLVAVNFAEGGKRFGSYTIHEGTRVTVRLEDGETADLIAFGSIVEMDGVCKLMTYRERD